MDPIRGRRRRHRTHPLRRTPAAGRGLAALESLCDDLLAPTRSKRRLGKGADAMLKPDTLYITKYASSGHFFEFLSQIWSCYEQVHKILCLPTVNRTRPSAFT